jgi:ketosteroid isomerase-like protein
MKPFFADPAFTVQYQLTGVEVSQSGDLGYTQGTQTYTMTDPKTGSPVNDRGKWLTVRKKQADESWKIVRDTASSDLPVSNPTK